MEELNSSQNSHILKQKHYKSYSIKSFIFVFAVASIMIMELVYGGSYLDEIYGVLSVAYILLSRKNFKRHDIITLILLIIVILIGLISNYFSNLINDLFPIIVDIIAASKIITTFYASKYFLNNEQKKQIIEMLVPFSKIFIISSFVCSIISQFVDIGMTTSSRFGIKSFSFLFDFSFQFLAIYIWILGVIVFSHKISDKKKKYYYFMALVSIVLTTKGPSLVLAFVFIILSVYFKKHKKISPFLMAFLIVGIGIIGSYQIQNYFLTDDVPRHLFTKYSFVTANDYFPLGSGFATYGSYQASVNYSPLYIRYGFNESWGLSPEYGFFLSDNFWQMALGQFGWFGFALYFYVFLRIFGSFSKNEPNNEKKAFFYAVSSQYVLHALGSSILSNASGVIGFMALALFFNVEYDSTDIIDRIKIKI